MAFDGAQANVELRGDGLIGLASDQQVHDLSLRIAQLGDALLYLSRVLQLSADIRILLQRLVNGLEQFRVVVRFFQQRHGSLTHGPHGDGHVGIPADHDDRQDGLALGQLDLQISAAQSGHAKVGDDASRSGQVGLVQKLFRGIVCGRAKIMGDKPRLQRVTPCFVVLNDENGGGLSPLG